MKAVCLFSGGLDSVLSAMIIARQGISVEAVYFKSVFWHKSEDNSKEKLLRDIIAPTGALLKIIDIDKEYLDIVKRPVYGYGKNLNPCIDCRIFLLKKAGQYMRETNASFIVTGEVLEQRPMSQSLDAINMIEKASRLNGLIVRPLSALLLAPSVPELKAQVQRSGFFSIKGRLRKQQVSLAALFGISCYTNPAGGCLLTDKDFCRRVKFVLKNKHLFNSENVEILKYGRLFKLSNNVIFVLGRNESDNNSLQALKKQDDFFLIVQGVAGPSGIIRGNANEYDIHTAARIMAGYSNIRSRQKVDIMLVNDSRAINTRLQAEPSARDFSQSRMI